MTGKGTVDVSQLEKLLYPDYVSSFSTTSNRMSSGIKVSVSSITTSPVSLKMGTAIKRTDWPAGPSMTVVSNLGWLPTK